MNVKCAMKNRLKHVKHWLDSPGLKQSRMFTGGPSDVKIEEILQLFKGHYLQKHLHTWEILEDAIFHL